MRKGAAPVIVVDPRAGHAVPASAASSAVRKLAWRCRSATVYFVVFDPEPVEGQITAVVQTLKVFIDIVAGRHRGKAPIVYGNCQGRLAITLALSHCQHAGCRRC